MSSPPIRTNIDSGCAKLPGGIQITGRYFEDHLPGADPGVDDVSERFNWHRSRPGYRGKVGASGGRWAGKA